MNVGIDYVEAGRMEAERRQGYFASLSNEQLQVVAEAVINAANPMNLPWRTATNPGAKKESQ